MSYEVPKRRLIDPGGAEFYVSFEWNQLQFIAIVTAPEPNLP